MARPRADAPTYSLTLRGGRYYVTWWEKTERQPKGAKHRVSCQTADPAEARRFLAELKARVTAEPPPRAPTVGAVVEGYLAARTQRPHSPTLPYLARPVLRHLADLPVDLLDDRLVSAYVADRRKEGCGGRPAAFRKTVRALSDGSLRRELGLVRTALGWAVRQKWIATAPHVPMPAPPPPRQRWLTRPEAAKLLAATRRPHVRLFIMLALYTAARSGAVLQLTWDRVDLAAGRIALGQGAGNKRRATAVPIPAPLREALAEAAAAATSPHVVAFADKPVRNIRNSFREAARRAGMPDVTPHVLRHTAATWMVQGGVPLSMVAAYLGNSVRMVETVYGHHSPDWLEAAATALAG